MVLGFGGGSNTPTVQITSKTSTANGYKFTLTAPTSETSWTDLTVIIQTGASSQSWANITQTALTGTGVQTQALVGVMTTTIYLNVTDLGGNGIMSNGDYFTLEYAFASGTSYTLTLQHEPTDGTMATHSWTA
jgi:hypothetical protein